MPALLDALKQTQTIAMLAGLVILMLWCTFKRSVGDHEGLVILREPPGDRRISMNPAFPPHSERSFDSASTPLRSAQDDFIAKGIA
jgi:hypothetical protein